MGQLALRQWHRFRAAEAANLVWALAILRAPSPQVWAAVLEKLAHAPAASFDDTDLHQIFQAYQLLDPAGANPPTSVQPSSHPQAAPHGTPSFKSNELALTVVISAYSRHSSLARVVWQSAFRRMVQRLQCSVPLKAVSFLDASEVRG